MLFGSELAEIELYYPELYRGIVAGNHHLNVSHVYWNN